MIEAEVGGVEFIALNTDAQSLQQSAAHVTLQIGADITRGLGSGSDPDRGRAAAMEDYDRIKSLLKGSDMVFITAGEGGGTGTGAAPVVARVARELGALTVGIVTKPFGFEGSRRLQAAETGIEALAEEVDTLIVVPEQPAAVGAGQADVDGRGLPRRRRRAAPGRPGHLGPDHAPGPDQPRLRRRAHDHVRRRQRAAGHRHGHGRQARGRRGRSRRPPRRCWRRRSRARKAILLSITGGRDLSLWEVNEAARAVQEAAHPDANIIFGAMVDEKLEDEVWVTVVATGYERGRAPPRPRARRSLREPIGEPRVTRTREPRARRSHASTSTCPSSSRGSEQRERRPAAWLSAASSRPVIP